MKIIVQGNHISSLTISFEYFLEKRKVINRVGSKIESAKSYPDAIIEIKLYEIKAGHMKTNNSLDIKISSITSNKPSESYEQPYSDCTKWTVLK